MQLHACSHLAGALLLCGGFPTLADTASQLLAPAPIVNDVTTLNPIPVNKIVAPHSVDEIVSAVKSATGPVSIGGGRFSMGGQTATQGAVQLDMREFNKIRSFFPEKKEITVEAGATWRRIQEHIDPHNLSVKIMQSYADFSVGGSLSVNVHGRYVGYGPLVLSVNRIGVVLADGTYVDASPNDHANIFYGAIGGYGGIGVITDATLSLADNVKMRRNSVVMSLADYKSYFFRDVRDNPKAIFHNADLYPNAYDTVRATTYEETDSPVTNKNRLVPWDRSYWWDRTVIGLVADAPGGKAFRRYLIDPIRFGDDQVVWRNYEASYTVMELEPSSRQDSTYVLQEYFVPVDRIDEFVPRMSKIFSQHHVNVLNVSIRHANADPGTLLAWAPQEVFAFVIYYKQGTRVEDREQVGVWTRELIDAAIASGGRYYLPYQIHATDAQFKAAYPGWQRFFELKRRLDPGNKFRNKLWDAYYVDAGVSNAMLSSARAHVVAVTDYRYPAYFTTVRGERAQGAESSFHGPVAVGRW